MNFIRKIITDYFKQKGDDLSDRARANMGCPPGTTFYAAGELQLSIANLYYSIAEAIKC